MVEFYVQMDFLIYDFWPVNYVTTNILILYYDMVALDTENKTDWFYNDVLMFFYVCIYFCLLSHWRAVKML